MPFCVGVATATGEFKTTACLAGADSWLVWFAVSCTQAGNRLAPGGTLKPALMLWISAPDSRVPKELEFKQG